MGDSSTELIARVPRSSREAQEWYDTLSPWYDVIVDPFERTYRASGIELLDPKPGEQLVDVGSGTGTALVSIARSVGETGCVVGVDVAEGMCEQARKKAAASTVSDRVAVVRGDALHLPVRSGALDAVFASFTLELFDTPAIPLVLEEWKRVVTEDGRVCVVALSKRDAGLATGLYERVHAIAPRYVDCRPIFARRLLSEHGFDVVEASDERMWGLPIELVLATV